MRVKNFHDSYNALFAGSLPESNSVIVKGEDAVKCVCVGGIGGLKAVESKIACVENVSVAESSNRYYLRCGWKENTGVNNPR